jgi:uncharacterized membrane protein
MGQGFGGHGFMFGGHFLEWIFWGAVLIIVGIYLRNRKPGAIGFGKKDNTLAILREQYAKGEIDEATFLERKRVLEENA